jgi:hypothetical protein
MWLHITIPEPASNSSSNTSNTTSATVITCNPGPVYLKEMPGFYDDYKTLCPIWAWFYIQTAPWCLRPVFDVNPRGWSGRVRGSVAAARVSNSSIGSSDACFYWSSLAYVVNVSDLSVTVKRLFDATWDPGCSLGVYPATQYVNGVLTRADVAQLMGKTINYPPMPDQTGW